MGDSTERLIESFDRNRRWSNDATMVGVQSFPRDRSHQCLCQKTPMFQSCSCQVEVVAVTCSTGGCALQLEVRRHRVCLTETLEAAVSQRAHSNEEEKRALKNSCIKKKTKDSA